MAKNYVLDQYGNILVGVTVELYTVGTTTNPLYTLTTDSSGAYDYSSVDEGNYDIKLSGGNLSSSVWNRNKFIAKGTHESRTDNPHSVTTTQISAIPTSGGTFSGDVSGTFIGCGSGLTNVTGSSSDTWQSVMDRENSTTTNVLISGTTYAQQVECTGASILGNPIKIVKLATAEIDAKVEAVTTLYTIPTGKQCVITKVFVRCTEATSISTEPEISLGANETYDDWVDNEYVADLTEENYYTAVNAPDYYAGDNPKPIYQAEDVIKVSVNTASVGTSQTIAIDLFGYLI